MSQTSGFFEAELLGDGTYDRIYSARQFAAYFANFIGSGVYRFPVGQLLVSSKAVPDMSVEVSVGNAFINGYWFNNSDTETLEIETADGTNPRYDAIVVGYNLLDRSISLYVKKGTPSIDPVKPTVNRNVDSYELCLAYVKVDAATTVIESSAVTDMRADKDICGYVTEIGGLTSVVDIAFSTPSFTLEDERITEESLIDVYYNQTYAAFNGITIEYTQGNGFLTINLGVDPGETVKAKVRVVNV